MHLWYGINHTIISVDFQDLTRDCRFNHVILEGIAKHHHVDYVEEHKEKADVLNPSLFDRLEQWHFDEETLL